MYSKGHRTLDPRHTTHNGVSPFLHPPLFANIADRRTLAIARTHANKPFSSSDSIQTAHTKIKARKKNALFSFILPCVQRESTTNTTTMTKKSITTDPLINKARLQIMKRQEDDIYHRHKTILPSQDDNAPDVTCRSKMLTWFLDIVDYFKYDKETVEIALNYLDRYDACQDRLEYQLTCMAALYTAVKIHERTALHPKLVASLSQGQFQEDDVIQQERKLLQRLKWRLHPPTTSAFVRELLPLVPKEVRAVVYELAQVQLQQALRLSSFRATPTYILAYAAVLNALESVNVSSSGLGYQMALALELDHDHALIVKTQSVLYKSISGTSVALVLSKKKRSMQNGVRVSTLGTGEASPRTTVVVH